MERIYLAGIIDAPGVVAANTFLTLWMPTTSKKFALALQVNVSNYATGASSTPNSMTARRISASTGGSLVAANTIARFIRTDEDPVMEVRTGNPTVATLAFIPTISFAPPISVGTGTGSPGQITTPPGTEYDIFPGFGIAFQTAAGNVNQVWNLEVAWQEVYLPPSS